jgi:hypothetical protein
MGLKPPWPGSPLLPSFNATENVMPHLASVLSIISAFAVSLSIFMVVRAFLKNRWEEAAPFRHYFEPEYDRSLLPKGSCRDNENLYDSRSRFDDFSARDPSAARGIQEIAARSGGVEAGINPEVI